MAPFETVQYWSEFYEDFDEDELYDWYSSCEWLSENILRRLQDYEGPRLRVLDVGCGNSPLLFTLAESQKIDKLVGIDFSDQAILRCNKYAADLPQEQSSKLKFEVGDGKCLKEVVGDTKFDIVVDKGCLDCFISGQGTQDVHQYLQQLAQVLKPSGTLFIVPVNGADIPHLLQTGNIIQDRHASGKLDEKIIKKWESAKNSSCDLNGQYEQCIYLCEVVGRDEKHLFVCNKTRKNGEVDKIECDLCGENYGYPNGFPTECGKCMNRLQRFALS
eukprot:TRINITY_DN6742_c1_g1_i2.p1 TRINITY_DN6742_c1_g1~~TRINITY_DN6742_c1_g1_i2.p1  ORF type:complete len:274 (+),score=49.48 TRINITY_DN6742_c1_g1_i2:107-928(+)